MQALHDLRPLQADDRGRLLPAGGERQREPALPGRRPRLGAGHRGAAGAARAQATLAAPRATSEVRANGMNVGQNL